MNYLYKPTQFENLLSRAFDKSNITTQFSFFAPEFESMKNQFSRKLMRVKDMKPVATYFRQLSSRDLIIAGEFPPKELSPELLSMLAFDHALIENESFSIHTSTPPYFMNASFKNGEGTTIGYLGSPIELGRFPENYEYITKSLLDVLKIVNDAA